MPFTVDIVYTDDSQTQFNNVEQVQPTPAGLAMINQEGIFGFVAYTSLKSMRIPARESGLSLPAGLSLPPGMIGVVQ